MDISNYAYIEPVQHVLFIREYLVNVRIHYTCHNEYV